MNNIIYTYEIPPYKTWCELRKIAGWPTYTQQSYNKVITNSLCFVIAKINKEIVGMGRLVGDNITSFYIQGVVVREQYQHQGIGTGIVNKLLSYAENETLEFATVHLFAHKGTEPFYQRCGFILHPNERKGAGMSLIISKSRP